MEPDLQKLLDQTKIAVFLNTNAAFYGSLLCNMEIVWDTEDTETAAVDGTTIYWNPDWFLTLSPDTRKTVLMHEIDHVARLHLLRRGTRDAKLWNYACDYRINNDLVTQKYSFKGIEAGCIDSSFDENGILAEEEIYEQLLSQAELVEPKALGGDIREGKSDQASHIVNVVAQAVQAANASHGTVPGKIKEYLDTFINPVVPWQSVLWDFFNTLQDRELSWNKPNRRYPDIYLPSDLAKNNGLEHLMYFLDVSGSISKSQIIRFNSEMKYVIETLQPEKVTLVQFDWDIQDSKVYEQGDTFDYLHVRGRGGTSLSCAATHIKEHKPTAAIIFSDLECDPISDPGIPIVWVISPGHGFTPDYGQIVRLPKE